MLGAQLLLQIVDHNGPEVLGPWRDLRQQAREYVPGGDPGGIDGADRLLAVEQRAQLVVVPDMPAFQRESVSIVLEQGGNPVHAATPRVSGIRKRHLSVEGCLAPAVRTVAEHSHAVAEHRSGQCLDQFRTTGLKGVSDRSP